MEVSWHHVWIRLAVAYAAGALLAQAQEDPASETVVVQTEVCVLDVVIVGTNILQIGTNALPFCAATNHIGQLGEGVELIAVHGPFATASVREARSVVLEKLARVGIPLVVVEDAEGEYEWRTHTDDDGIRTIKLSTDHLGSVSRLLQGRPNASSKPAVGPSLQTTLEWDTTIGEYQFSRVELGLVGKRVWLVHEQRESDEESGTVGIRLKKEW